MNKLKNNKLKLEKKAISNLNQEKMNSIGAGNVNMSWIWCTVRDTRTCVPTNFTDKCQTIACTII
jgi:hypothetical protein